MVGREVGGEVDGLTLLIAYVEGRSKRSTVFRIWNWPMLSVLRVGVKTAGDVLCCW